MNNTNTGGPAFPVAYGGGCIEGMTLRDYFAAKAMPAILDQASVHDSRDLKNAAWIAYQVSDEMLKAREA
jgi:hypothetical protein